MTRKRRAVSPYPSVPFSTKRVDDPTLPEGTEKYSERGSNGAKCKLYRIVSVDGVEVSRTLESSSYYMPHNATLLVGTKKAEPVMAEPAPEAPKSTEVAPAIPAETAEGTN